MPASANRVNISIDLQTGRCRIGSQEAYLGNRERQLFGILLANIGEKLTKSQLEWMIWGKKMSKCRVAEVVFRIRKKLGYHIVRSPQQASEPQGYWIPNGDTEPTEVANNPINPLRRA